MLLLGYTLTIALYAATFGAYLAYAVGGRRPLLGIGVAAAAVAMVGSLGTIVEAASLMFLGTFAVVDWIAARRLDGSTVLAWVGVVGCAAATVLLALRVWSEAPVALGAVVVVAVLAFVARQPLLERVRTA